MDWQWLVDEGLIEGEAPYYINGEAAPEEVNRAISIAYRAANDEQRRKIVDMAWASGSMEGQKEYWYDDHSRDVQDFAAAYSGVRVDEETIGTANESDPRFGIAGGAELWKNTDTGEIFIIYMVPGTEDDPVYLRYSVPSEADAQSFFGPDQPVIYTRQITSAHALWTDTIDFGSSDDIANTSANPFDSWASTLEVESLSQPWMLDQDYQNLLAMSVIEGRELTEAEIHSTEWWRGHTEAERAWMDVYHSDPSEAQRRIDDNRQAQTNMFRDAGLTGFNEELTNFFADKVTRGEWSVEYAMHELEKLADPYFENEAMDEGLAVFMEDNSIDLGQSVDEEQRVRDIVTKWLGPNFGNWDENVISDWAARLRNEDEAEEYLIEELKNQKDAMFPGYNRESDFNTIAQPWRSMASSVWGFTPQMDDEVLNGIIKANDADQAAQTLRTTGLDRGYDRVVNDLSAAVMGSDRNNVRGAV